MSIGATIAKMLRLNSVRFYENGVISLNLPVCAQVVGGRATRTTHPKVMKGFQEIITLVAGEPFTIENPYIWKTKADVVKVITNSGCEDLIKHSMTCTHTWEMSNEHTHCGGCSQCIDRRLPSWQPTPISVIRWLLQVRRFHPEPGQGRGQDHGSGLPRTRQPGQEPDGCVAVRQQLQTSAGFSNT